MLIHLIYGAVIAALVTAFAFQTWRKRVWKRRALGESRGLWHTLKAAFVDEIESAASTGKAIDKAMPPWPTPKRGTEWPTIIEDKEK